MGFDGGSSMMVGTKYLEKFLVLCQIWIVGLDDSIRTRQSVALCASAKVWRLPLAQDSVLTHP